MPEGRAHHVLDRARLAVGQFDLDLLAARTGFGAWTRGHGRCRWLRGSRLSGVRFQRLTIPLRIIEMVMRLYEIIDREVVLPVVEPRAATDDLLEFNHGVDRTHQNDVADVAGVHPG